ncbi:MAG TPA: hypothetical protein VFW45_14485 [Candidatus Polarisedimenticolia bacterium]|nr:hypothetical protein [Candidatus Polarisedimenticolia bacterium]
MGDELKSAYELAMEKLVKKDKESGSSQSSAKLSAKQKEKIASIRSEVEAKLAEREILFKSEMKKARREGAAHDAIEAIEEAYRRDRERLLSRQEERIHEVREKASTKR